MLSDFSRKKEKKNDMNTRKFALSVVNVFCFLVTSQRFVTDERFLVTGQRFSERLVTVVLLMNVLVTGQRFSDCERFLVTGQRFRDWSTCK